MGRSLGKGMREFKDSVTGKDDHAASCRRAAGRRPRPELAQMRPFPRRLRHGEEATLVEHLGELRTRLFISLGALAAAFVVTYVFHGHLLHWLNRAAPGRICEAGDLQPDRAVRDRRSGSASGPRSLLALPVVFWQLWAFLAPAFEEHRQRSMALLVGFATLLGLGGVAFGYYVILPPAIHFLTNYDSSHFEILVRARDYYRFVSFVLLGVALAFEVPVFVLAPRPPADPVRERSCGRPGAWASS